MTRRALGRVVCAAALGCALRVSGAAASPSSVFSAERAWTHLEAQCAFGPRVPGTPAHAACLAYIRGVLERAGARVSLQAFRDTLPGTGNAVELTNVIARVGPERSGGVLLGAHWDSRPWAERDPDPARRDEPILGANDGASGAAVLLALAEMWSVERPAIPVTLVFFDGEDLGRESHVEEYLAGSRHFAERLPAIIPEVAVVLDMVGSATMTFSVEAYSREMFPDWASLIDGLAVDLGLSTYQSDWGPTVYDDHLPLIQAGLPTVLLIDFRDPFWHTHGDTPAHCSKGSLGDVGRVIAGMVDGGAIR